MTKSPLSNGEDSIGFDKKDSGEGEDLASFLWPAHSILLPLPLFF